MRARVAALMPLAFALERSVAVELARLLLQQLPIIILAGIVTPSVLIFWFADQFPTWVSIAWLLGVALVNGYRVWLYHGYRHADDESLLRRSRGFTWSSAFAGVLWSSGLVAVFLGVVDQDRWLVLALYCATAAGAASAQAPSPISVVLFMAPPIVSAAICLMISAPVMHLALVALLLFFLYAMCVFAYRNYRMIDSSIRVRFEQEQFREQLQRQSVDLARLIRVKDRFLAAVSHDLRQPAQVICMLAGEIHRINKDAQWRSYTGSLVQASDQINDLITRLLDMARLDLEQEKAKPEWFDVQEVFDRLLPVLSIKAQVANIRLRIFRSRYEVWADPLFLERILQNIIANALDHSGSHTVSIGLRAGEGRLRLLIIDRGCGIEPALIHRLDALQRGDADPAVTAGSVHGLGLVIASRLSRLGGQVLTARAESGAGTLFELTFPHWRRPTSESGVPGVSPVAGSSAVGSNLNAVDTGRAMGSTILVIEDDALVREGLRLMLERTGCRVLTATSGADALAKVAASRLPLSLILTDWRLGQGECAGDFLPSLLSTLATPVPLLILSGTRIRDEDTKVVAFVSPLASRIRLLEKPVATDRILAEIEQMLSPGA